jgi:hypothetical protein
MWSSSSNETWIRAALYRVLISKKPELTRFLAEGVGFEPTVTQAPRRFSRPFP